MNANLDYSDDLISALSAQGISYNSSPEFDLSSLNFSVGMMSVIDTKDQGELFRLISMLGIFGLLNY